MTNAFPSTILSLRSVLYCSILHVNQMHANMFFLCLATCVQAFGSSSLNAPLHCGNYIGASTSFPKVNRCLFCEHTELNL